jgi:methionyl-tRNA synthetase
MINNLGSSDLAVQLKELLSRRMNQRRAKVSSLLQYLHKGKQTYAELELDPLLNFEHLSKATATIVSMVTGLSKPLNHNEPFELESDNETAEVEIDLQLSMQEKLARAIDREMNSKICSKSRTMKDVMGIVKKKLAIFEVEGKRRANLERCYENLNS